MYSGLAQVGYIFAENRIITKIGGNYDLGHFLFHWNHVGVISINIRDRP